MGDFESHFNVSIKPRCRVLIPVAGAWNMVVSMPCQLLEDHEGDHEAYVSTEEFDVTITAKEKEV